MKDKAEIVCILDRSGSMASIIDDAIGGYNTFLLEQKKIPKPADLMVVQFDEEYKVVYQGPLNDAPAMNKDTYVPRGCTALLDALGRTLNSVGERLSITPEADRPDKVIFLIVTDGMENASQEFTHEQIKKMVNHQEEKYGWEFIYVGSNQDAIAVAGNIGIRSFNAVNYASSKKGARASYQIMSSAVGSTRSRGTSIADSMGKGLDVDEEGNIIKRS